MMINEH